MIGRIPITDVLPIVHFGGEIFPVKAVAGETIPISGTVIFEGENQLGVEAILIDDDGSVIQKVLMQEISAGSDRYEGSLTAPTPGNYSFYLQAFDNAYLTWRRDCEIKINANIDADLCCEIGARIFEEAMREDKGQFPLLAPVLATLRNTSFAPANRFSVASSPHISEYFQQFPLRRLVTKSDSYPLRADRERALFGSWYEFFPRSEGAISNHSGTFSSSAKRLPDIAAMGFDVIYLPPIHPIGYSHRKGPNNGITAASSDPGVPWAIGSTAGGHDTINPELGSMEDFEDFVTSAKEFGLEIALDLAIQTSPDHPWVKDHPEWFTHRPDGSIAYAENPPKKYQDIYPINFDHDFDGIVEEVLRIIRLWISKGVTLFRVDNPHTKPVGFWRDILSVIGRESPEVIFLAEAFTRPAMMHALGKIGFHQSYTYFTWRTSKEEITSYANELAHNTSAFFRPNFWVNTPDILPLHLQSGNPAMFALRAVLAATLSPSWGMYSGYEIFEHYPVKADSEEYLDSEKYQIRIRDWNAFEKRGLSLAPFITQINQIRRNHPALQRLRNLVFHHTDSDAILAYSKREGSDLVLVVVNLDPNFTQESTVHWNMRAMGLTTGTFTVRDLLDDAIFIWSEYTFVKLDPSQPSAKVAHIVSVESPSNVFS